MRFDVDSPDWKSKIADSVNAVISFITNPTYTRTIWGKFLAAIFALVLVLLALCLLLYLLGRVFEACAKALEAYKNSGLKLPFSGKDKLPLARRQNFCTVLSGDFDHLAKGENWNDQYYTDLEAEVETEGGYYASALSRVLGRRSFGLRRVPTLIQAIESSTERGILLVGEPGSGKSVALRHLGNQLAQRGKISRAVDVKIPLYINLRELGPAPGTVPNAEFIKNFVF
jgi:hypothetical protein